MTYYHGGVPGLGLGDQIRPPTETGVLSIAELAADLPGGELVRKDRVYLTTDLRAAATFAAMHPSWEGEVYEVDPELPLEVDPDYIGPGGASWQAPHATIVRRLGCPKNADDLRAAALASAFGRPAAPAKGRKR